MRADAVSSVGIRSPRAAASAGLMRSAPAGSATGQPALPTQLARRANLLDEVEDTRVTLPHLLVRRGEPSPGLDAIHSSTDIPDLAHARNLGPGTAGCKPGLSCRATLRGAPRHPSWYPQHVAVTR
jgi:hypothetical protein